MRISDDDFAEISARAALRRDAHTVEAYGEQHPETWTCAEVDRERGRLVAWFTHDIDGHQAELQRLVERPDRLEVRRSKRSRLQLLSLQAALEATLVDRCQREGWVSLGIGDIVGTAVSVTLPPGAAHVAEELRRAYGDAVKVDFGVYKPLSKDGE